MLDGDRQLAAQWAKERLQRQNFVILDTETTGLDSTAQICQIAVIDHAGQVLLDRLVKPTVEIEPGAIAIHGITNERVKFAAPFHGVFVPLLQAVGASDLVIFNADYDTRLIQQSLRPYGIRLPFPYEDRRQCHVFTNGGAIHCAMLWFSQWVGDWNQRHGNYKWQRLPGGDHSALGDCVATLDVIERMASDVEADQG